MKCGLSTACFYPMKTDEGLQLIFDQKVPSVEIFLNSFCELEDDYLTLLKQILSRNGTRVCAIHPFTSMMEPFFFSSMYDARFWDGVELYKKYFHACSFLEAPILVFHGDYKNTTYSFERYCKNYSILRKIGREYGVSLCQENVVRCKSGDPDMLLQLRQNTDDDVEFVFDLKQARRANISFSKFWSVMDGKIRHLHLSDYALSCDCLPPGTGLENWKEIFQTVNMERVSMVIELYRDGFETIDQLIKATSFVNEFGCVKTPVK